MFIAHPDFLRTHSKYILMYIHESKNNPSHSHCSVTKWWNWMRRRLKMIWIPMAQIASHCPMCRKHLNITNNHPKAFCSQSSLKILLFENRPDSTSGLWARTMRGFVHRINMEKLWGSRWIFAHQRPALKDNLLNSSSQVGWKKTNLSLKKRYPKYLWLRIIDINWGVTLSPILEQTLLPSFPIFFPLKSQLFCSVKVFFDGKTKKNAFLEATNRAKHNP